MLTNVHRIIGLTLIGLLPCAAACGDEVFLMSESHLITADGEDMLLSSGCQSLSGDTGSTGAAIPTTTPDRRSFDIHHDLRDGGILVFVRSSDGETLARRAYSEEFLAEGREDTFTVELSNDESLRLLFWGGPQCGSPRPSKHR